MWYFPVNYSKFFRRQFPCRTVFDKSFMPVLQLGLTLLISEIEKMHFIAVYTNTQMQRNSVKEFHVSILDPKTKLGGLNDDEHSNSKPEFYFPCYGNYYRSYSNSRNPPHYIRSWEDTLKRTSHTIGSFISTFELHQGYTDRIIRSTNEETAIDTVRALIRVPRTPNNRYRHQNLRNERIGRTAHLS